MAHLGYPRCVESPRGRCYTCGAVCGSDDRPSGVTIKELPAELRPRERLGTGTRQATALEVGATLLGRFRSVGGLAQASLEELIALPGVGETKAARVLAALELARRLLEPPPQRRTIRSAADAAAVCASMRTLDREHFRVILLSTRHEVLGIADVSVGGLASAPVHPREVFKEAIRHSAAAVIVVHNHPSGHPEPSGDDVAITAQLRAAGRLMGIEILDHIIIGERAFVSLREQRQGFP